MTELPKTDIGAILAEGTAVDEAIRLAVREAVRRHKLLGNPIAVLRDGKVCWLKPAEIEIPEEPPAPSPAT